MKKITILALLILGMAAGALADEGYPYINDGQFYLGLHSAPVKLTGGDYDYSAIRMWSGLHWGFYFNRAFGLEFSGSSGFVRPREWESQFEIKDGPMYRTYLFPLEMNMRLNLMDSGRFVPYVLGGAGIMFWDLRTDSHGFTPFPIERKGDRISGLRVDSMLDAGLGAEIFITENISLDMSGRYHYLINQTSDMLGYDTNSNGCLEARISLNWHFATFGSFQFGLKKDSDRDGVRDRFDGEMYIPEDLDGYRDGDGIPDPDNDNDGVLDTCDQCPDAKEDMDGFMDYDGCPDPDNDNDGIPDLRDKCPDQAETMNGYQDQDGCPDTKPVAKLEVEFATKTPIVLDGVTFASGSTKLTESAKEVLDKVVTTLKAYPDMELEIDGYTDNTGSASLNRKLSAKRAESVRNYLISQGIEPNRLVAKGLGPENPVASNDTKEGRAKNRRIEFLRTK